MTYAKAQAKWPWRDFLTDDERGRLDAADEAKRVWQELNRERAAITNRALQRAKYAAGPASPEGKAKP